MAIYPESLSKLSEASVRREHLRTWLTSNTDKDTFIAGITIQDENSSTNDLIPAYDFIEKLADAVVLDAQELKEALTDDDIESIFIAKDITLDSNVAVAYPSSVKYIIGIQSILNLNGKSINIGNKNFYIYGKVSGTGTINGTGSIWIKDILCTSSNHTPITADEHVSKSFERFVDLSDYKTLYNEENRDLRGWHQLFIDNTFAWKDILNKIDNDVNTERIARENDIASEESARINADNDLQDAIDAEIEARTEDINDLTSALEDEKRNREESEAALSDLITDEIADRTAAIETEKNARESADSDLQDAIDAEAQARTDADADLEERLTTEIHKVYKPKGTAYVRVSNDIATLHSSNDDTSESLITPADLILGDVYNIILPEESSPNTEFTFKDSGNNDYTLYLSNYEDVGCVNSGTTDAPIYKWNDFGGKINLSNYYTKAEVDSKSAAATTTVVQGDNTDIISTTGSDGHVIYTIHSEKETLSIVSDAGLKLTPGTEVDHTTPKTLELQLADTNDVNECIALFNNL